MRPSPASPKTHPEAPRLLHQVRDKIRLKLSFTRNSGVG